MSRGMHKLSPLRISKLRERGFYADGGNLYLQVAPGGTKSWVFRYKQHGRTRDMGLGSANTLTLAEARDRATACRKLLLDGIDPLAKREAERAAQRLEIVKALSFEECATAYITSNRAGWSNAQHAHQWSSTLETYAFPVLGKLPVAKIDVTPIMKVLEPIWLEKNETASRLRGRIEKVLNWATARGYREGENPARWHGHLENLLPSPDKVQDDNHHESMPHPEVAAFMGKLGRQQSIAALALRFIILTAARTNEALGARWSEIDRAAGVWTIPAERMKKRVEHRVPLSPAALEVLEALPPQQGEFVFSITGDKPLTSSGPRNLLLRMGMNTTVHGFRSSFRVWAAECTDFPSEVAEAALAHAISEKQIKAYLRTTFFDRRRQMMDTWAAYCGCAQ
jgi:integrase